MSKRNGNGTHALKLDPHNARKHPDRNKAQIAASLKELGAGRSILVDATDTIIAGNGVYEQAQVLGYKVKVIEADGKTLIAVKRPDLKGAKARRMALADNRATETSEWDTDVLADLAANDADALAGLWERWELEQMLGKGEPIDPNKEWQGMPEHHSDEIRDTAIQCIVRFLNEDDLRVFEKLIGYKLYRKGNTYSTWFPKHDFDQLGRGTEIKSES